ncbi:hypothetical protein QZM22_26820 [Burkholderia oklahomensis]|uniref:hypothetical protein n=1 Tax=Burkholderia oklahomensis TaxID=342113 RepID=UPI00265593D9|nr:hypothetical protein [Burkholderia oklahomensis]MDN7676012.1 hypothetical protein [Burkholderia oklahomensis]
MIRDDIVLRRIAASPRRHFTASPHRRFTESPRRRSSDRMRRRPRPSTWRDVDIIIASARRLTNRIASPLQAEGSTAFPLRSGTDEPARVGSGNRVTPRPKQAHA